MQSLRTCGMGLAAALSLVLTSSAAAVTFSPTRTDDPAPGPCRPGDCSLREAVRAAVLEPGNDRVVLRARDYEFELPGAIDDNGLAGDLDVFNSSLVEIVGRGPGKTTIDADGLDRIVEVFPGARLEVRNLAMQGGVAADPNPVGGAILNEGTLTMERVIIEGNAAAVEGGGLENREAGRATLIATTFRDNDATDEFARGGAINNRNEARMTIARSKFVGNDATNGGGITNQNAARLELRRSTVSGNSTIGVTSSGGGIFNQNDARLTVVDSTISGNDTEGQGGAVYTQNDSVASFKNTTLSDNEAPEGGAIYLNNWPTVSFAFSTLAANTATTSGGAILDSTSTPGVSTPQPPFLTFRATIAAGNSAPTNPSCEVLQPAVWETKGFNVEDGGDTCLFGLGSDQPNADAALRPLDRYGGPTTTHALRASSDAVDAAPKRGCPKRDQRGVGRPQGPRCDTGSYELR